MALSRLPQCPPGCSGHAVPQLGEREGLIGHGLAKTFSGTFGGDKVSRLILGIGCGYCRRFFGGERIVHELYRLGFAEVREWSKPQPTGRINEIMRVLTRYVLVE